MDSISTILATVDVKGITRLDERQVAKLIDQYISTNNIKEETFHWEKAAFEFYPNYKNKQTGWGTYFGPLMIWPDQTGQSFEYPSIQMLSEKVLDYYSHRAIEAQNPILIARYSGLVYDFYNLITKKRTQFTVKLLYVNALIETANGDYHFSPIYTVEKLRRALKSRYF